MSENAEYNRLLKVVMVGESQVGKTAFLSQFTRNEYQSDIPSTIGVEFGVKTIDLDGEKIKLQIWDTAGQERFRSITKSYMRGASIAAVMYDITNRESFDEVKKWVQEIRLHGDENCALIILGNKCDSELVRQVKTYEGQAVAGEFNALFMEVSAKDATNVQNAMIEVARKVIGIKASGAWRCVSLFNSAMATR